MDAVEAVVISFETVKNLTSGSKRRFTSRRRGVTRLGGNLVISFCLLQQLGNKRCARRRINVSGGAFSTVAPYFQVARQK
jgi:hypothetical protein